MSDQKVPTRNAGGGTGRGAQAFAGVAGAVACLGIGWAVGVRSAPARPAPAPVAAPITQPLVPGLPARSDEGDDGGFQWGTVPGSGLTPAQPGTGIAPPTTGSGPSAVASTSSALAPATTTAPTTSTAGPTTNTVRLTSANPTGVGGQR